MITTASRAVLAAVAFASLAPAAQAQTGELVRRLYVFGDSYSDSGNGYALTKKPPSPPYAQRFTNGPTAVEVMATAWGLALRPSSDATAATDASLNFAVSG